MPVSLRMLGVAIALPFLLLGNPANVAAVDFAAAKSYPVGTSPGGVAVGDFNGDGKLDIAVANAGSGNVSILLGNGDGTFQAAVNFASGNNPTTVAVGDFNGDGKLDLALFQPGDFSSSQNGSVSILLGNGDGTFQAPKTLALGPASTVIAVADFNLDGKSDLAVFNTASVGIYLGKGDGTFQPVIGVSTPSADGGAMVVADFNGDSKPDLAVTYSGSTPSTGFFQGLDILLGNGDGTFTFDRQVSVAVEFSILSPGFSHIHSVAAADLNHDGKADLLIGSNGPGFDCPHILCTRKLTKISTFLGNGDGSFQGEQIVASAIVQTSTSTHSSSGSEIDRPFMGDFNGDGKLDLAYRMTPVSNSVSQPSSLEIQLGKGDGTFNAPFSSGLQNCNPFADSIVAAHDLNGDKLTDLIALGTANDIDVLLNTSPASGADLDILTSGPTGNTVGVGTNLTYTADVLNLGPQDATGVTFTDTLPNNVNFVSATTSQGSCVQSNGIVTCNVGALASPFDFTVNIVVTPTVAGTLTNSMNVTANETDPNPANNTATQTTTVVPVFKLTITKIGNGSGTVTTADGRINCGTACTATYLSGTGLQVNETPDANSVFAGWSGACTGTSACAITMSADMTVTANFVLGEKLSVVLAGTGSGSVTSKDGAINCANSGGNCSSLYAPGTAVSLTAAPAAPSVFGGWSGACSGSDPNTCTVTMNSAQAVTATFNPPPPDFTLAPASTSFTLQTGAQVTDALTLTEQNGFSGPVTLSCAVVGAAPMPACAVSPSTVTLGSNPASSTLTMTAPTTLAALSLPLNKENRNTTYAVVLPFPLLLGGIGLASRNFKKRRRGFRLLVGSVITLFAVLGVLAGCGGGTVTPPPQNYTVTVTAANASGTLHHSTTVTLTVQ
jgi:uncharacterized repeat protein (TIGR01451 family)